MTPAQSPPDGASQLAPDFADFLAAPLPVRTTVPQYRLYSTGSAMLATLLGTTLAGGIVLAVNFWRSGRPRAACWAVAAGLLLLPLHIATCSVLSLWLAYAYFDALQGGAVGRHLQARGKLASAWGAAGIGLVFPVLAAAVAVSLAGWLFPEQVNTLTGGATDGRWGERISFGRDEIHFSGDASEADARNLAATLQDMQVFGRNGALVLLAKWHGEYTVSFRLSSRACRRPAVLAFFRQAGQRLASETFQAPVIIRLCNEQLDVRQELNFIPGLAKVPEGDGQPQ